MLKDIKGIAILVILVLGALFYWHVSSKMAKADRLESENGALVTRVTALEGKAQAYDQALLDKQAREQTARSTRQNIGAQLQQVKNEDADAAAYLGSVIPASVRRAYAQGLAAGQPGQEDARAAGADGH